MLSFVRAGLAAALTLFALVPALAADKPFHRGNLDEAAIKLEAQIKSDAGSVTKPVATLKHDADAAFQKKDYRTGMVVLGQIVTAAPNDAASWLRLARAMREAADVLLLADDPQAAREVAALAGEQGWTLTNDAKGGWRVRRD